MKYFDTTLLVALAALSNAAPSQKFNVTMNSDKDYLIFGISDQYSISPPFYPSPLGGRIENVWQDAYNEAKAIVETLDLAEKVNITTGIGMSWSRCGGTTGSVKGDGLEFAEGLCGNDGPLGVRGADFDTAYPAALTVASSFNKQLILIELTQLATNSNQKVLIFSWDLSVAQLGIKPLLVEVGKASGLIHIYKVKQ